MCEGTPFYISISSLIITSQNNKSINNILYSKTIINSDVNVIYYYSKDVVRSSVWCISQKYHSTRSPLYVPMEEHDNIMDENNRIEIIEF